MYLYRSVSSFFLLVAALVLVGQRMDTKDSLFLANVIKAQGNQKFETFALENDDDDGDDDDDDDTAALC